MTSRTGNLAGAFIVASVMVLSGAICAAVRAEDSLRIIAGQRGHWVTSVPELGQRAGIFRKHGLALKLRYLDGFEGTTPAVVAGRADIGVGTGILGVVGEFSAGAPVRIIGAALEGAGDLFWYVKADSPIRTLADTGGKTIAYLEPTSVSRGVVTAFVKQYGLEARPVATGTAPRTLRKVLSGQIDVGWSLPPFGVAQLAANRIRIVATGNDAATFKGRTVRVISVNLRTLQLREPVVERFMRAYRETIEWMYAGDAALDAYADWVGISREIARRVRDDFYPKAALDSDRILRLDASIADALAVGYLETHLTEAQLVELIRILPRK